MNDIATVQPDTGTAVSVVSRDPVLSEILSLARDPHMDANKLEVMVRMQREQEDRQRAHDLEDRMRVAEGAYTRAMNEVQQEMPPVVRDAANLQTKSRYAKLETIIETLMPIATRHGFTLTFKQVPPEEAKNVRLQCKVAHTDGHSEIYPLECRIDNVGIQGNINKTEIHGFASAMSYLRRYLTTMVFNIATPDDDGNAAGRRLSQDRSDPPLGSAWAEAQAVALNDEPNAWKWMGRLMAAFAEAPNRADLDAVADLPVVRHTRDAAPAEAREKIDTAFNAAIARLKARPKKPVEDKAEQPVEKHDFQQTPKSDAKDQQPSGFEAMMIDADGEPKDRLYEDPFQFASDFMVAWRDGHADQRLALVEFNADALDEARVLDHRADDMLAALDEPVEQKVEPPLPVVEPPVERGKTSWVGYVRLFKAALDPVEPARVEAWLLAQRDTLAGVPMGQRVLAIQAASARLGAANVTPPSWLAGMMRPASGPATKADAAPLATSSDTRWVDRMIADLDAIDTNEGFQTLVKADAIQRVMGRLQRDNRALFDRADAAFLAKHRALQAAAG